MKTIMIRDDHGEYYEIVDTKKESKCVGNSDDDSVVYLEVTYTIRKKNAKDTTIPSDGVTK